jgi:hypothetical protein
MSTKTKTYRVYCFDGVKNIVSADWLEAVDDQDALAKAEAARYGTQCEVWDGKRLVAQLGANRREA